MIQTIKIMSVRDCLGRAISVMYERDMFCNNQFLINVKFTQPYTSPSLVIYLAFLAKVANLYYMILTAFKKYWPYTVAKFASGTQDRFI